MNCSVSYCLLKEVEKVDNYNSQVCFGRPKVLKNVANVGVCFLLLVVFFFFFPLDSLLVRFLFNRKLCFVT